MIATSPEGSFGIATPSDIGRDELDEVLTAVSDNGVFDLLLRRTRGVARRNHTIIATYLGRIVVLSRDAAPELRARLMPLLAEQAWFGGAAVAANLASAPIAHEEASGIAEAMRALDRPGLLAGAAEAGIAGLLLHNGDTATGRRFLDAQLGPVGDGPRGDALLLTALAYLDEHGAVNETAKALHLHPNTVRQRLERLDATLGESWREGARRLDIHVALRLWQLSRASGGAAE